MALHAQVMMFNKIFNDTQRAKYEIMYFCKPSI